MLELHLINIENDTTLLNKVIKLNNVKMKNASTILKNIMTKLGMEVKLEQMKLSDGVTVIEADSFEPNMDVFIVAEDDQKIPLPIGEYELEDGKLLVVEMEGVIASVNEATTEEEPIAEEEVAVEAEVETQASAPQPKSIIESTSKEYKFSMPDGTYLSSNDSLKEYVVKDGQVVDVLTKVSEGFYDEKTGIITDVVEFSAEPKPISFNPENLNKVEVIELSSKKPKATRDSILESIYNSK